MKNPYVFCVFFAALCVIAYAFCKGWVELWYFKVFFQKKLKNMLPASASKFGPHMHRQSLQSMLVNFSFTNFERIKDAKVENGVITDLLLTDGKTELWVNMAQPMIPDYLNDPGVACEYGYHVSTRWPVDVDLFTGSESDDIPADCMGTQIGFRLLVFSPAPIFHYSLDLSKNFIEEKGITKMQYPELKPKPQILKVSYWDSFRKYHQIHLYGWKKFGRIKG